MQTIESSVLRVAVSEKGAKVVNFVAQNSQIDYFKDVATQKALEVIFRGAEQEENLADILPWTVVDKGDSRVSLALIDDNSSYKKFPFHFEAILTYALEGSGIDIKFYLKNNSHKDMPFSLKFVIPVFSGWEVNTNANEIVLNKDKTNLTVASPNFTLTAESNQISAAYNAATLASDSDEDLRLSIVLS
ncbi:hypothetical protein [Lactobacillus sp. wkB10]|uniref:aldose epimerase family protein n=1 Tax=Lactobacillus sp. wkB10 TaxID=1545701 RepID=UPI000514236F|nr:hypothetical protein [Lactobacillus sp. wkB10]KGG54830.1 LacX protein, plasmid [Lactobacillus sp. wkB10]MCT6891155.1 aldose epimerase [Lactobacillus sp.]